MDLSHNCSLHGGMSEVCEKDLSHNCSLHGGMSEVCEKDLSHNCSLHGGRSEVCENTFREHKVESPLAKIQNMSATPVKSVYKNLFQNDPIPCSMLI